MTTIGTLQISDYDGRILEINVTGVCRQNVTRVSNYTMRVPHSRMNEAMQEINSLGGKISSVTLLGESIDTETKAESESED